MSFYPESLGVPHSENIFYSIFLIHTYFTVLLNCGCLALDFALRVYATYLAQHFICIFWFAEPSAITSLWISWLSMQIKKELIRKTRPQYASLGWKDTFISFVTNPLRAMMLTYPLVCINKTCMNCLFSIWWLMMQQITACSTLHCQVNRHFGMFGRLSSSS